MLLIALYFTHVLARRKAAKKAKQTAEAGKEPVADDEEALLKDLKLANIPAPPAKRSGNQCNKKLRYDCRPSLWWMMLLWTWSLPFWLLHQ